MTREEAVKKTPPGFVECSTGKYGAADDAIRINFLSNGVRDSVYAIPAPKEPRRAEVVVEFNNGGTALSCSCVGDTIRKFIGGNLMNYEAVANSKFRVTIEEVLE